MTDIPHAASDGDEFALPVYAYEVLEPLPPVDEPEQQIPPDPYIPPQLWHFAATVKAAGSADLTPRHVLAWFGRRNRVAPIMARIAVAMKTVGLAHGGSFVTGGLGDRIRYFSDERVPELVLPSERMDERGLLLVEDISSPPDGVTPRTSRLVGDPAMLATDTDWLVRRAAARYDETPEEVLRALAADPVVAVREAVARNRRTPAAILCELAERHPAGVAANPATPEAVLEALARIDRWAVRMALAGNPSTPPAVLVQLSEGADLRLRINLAGNPSVPDHERRTLLQQLEQDRDHYVRLWMAVSPTTPHELLERRQHDKHRHVRSEAADRLQRNRRSAPSAS